MVSPSGTNVPISSSLFESYWRFIHLWIVHFLRQWIVKWRWDPHQRSSRDHGVFDHIASKLRRFLRSVRDLVYNTMKSSWYTCLQFLYIFCAVLHQNTTNPAVFDLRCLSRRHFMTRSLNTDYHWASAPPNINCFPMCIDPLRWNAAGVVCVEVIACLAPPCHLVMAYLHVRGQHRRSDPDQNTGISFLVPRPPYVW
jgi:hypothetical protein